MANGRPGPESPRPSQAGKSPISEPKLPSGLGEHREYDGFGPLTPAELLGTIAAPIRRNQEDTLVQPPSSTRRPSSGIAIPSLDQIGHYGFGELTPDEQASYEAARKDLRIPQSLTNPDPDFE